MWWYLNVGLTSLCILVGLWNRALHFPQFYSAVLTFLLLEETPSERSKFENLTKLWKCQCWTHSNFVDSWCIIESFRLLNIKSVFWIVLFQEEKLLVLNWWYLTSKSRNHERPLCKGEFKFEIGQLFLQENPNSCWFIQHFVSETPVNEVWSDIRGPC